MSEPVKNDNQALVQLDQPFNEKTASLNELSLVAQMFAASGMFKDATSKAQSFTKMMVGKDLGIPMTRALTEVQMIQGKPTISANLMAALIKRSGKYKYKILEHTDEKCSILFSEKIDGQWEECGPPSTFTMDDARKAELTKNATWKKFPKNMLFSRALSNGLKQYCGDVCLGSVYTPDELDPNAQINVEGEYVPKASTAKQEVINDVVEATIVDIQENGHTRDLSQEELLTRVEKLVEQTRFDLPRFLKDSKVKALKSLDVGALNNIHNNLKLRLESMNS